MVSHSSLPQTLSSPNTTSKSQGFLKMELAVLKAGGTCHLFYEAIRGTGALSCFACDCPSGIACLGMATRVLAFALCFGSQCNANKSWQ